MRTGLPIPPHFEASRVGEVWKVEYQDLFSAAQSWREKYDIPPAADDDRQICLLLIDVQNTFCMPDYELFVAGRSGTGAVDDNRRLCRFIYQNLGAINQVVATMDTHHAVHIFHSIFLVNDEGEHPPPNTQVSYNEIQAGKWKFNPEVSDFLGISPEEGQRHLEYYTRQLAEKDKFDLTIWPYHAMLGGLSHAMVPAVHASVFFHSICRGTDADIFIKGRQSLTEHYSAVGPEVERDVKGNVLAQKTDKFVGLVEEYDAVVVAGQAKSHCVNWTVSDMLDEIQQRDPALADKVYLLEDCTSPVVIPDVVDFTEPANEAFERFAEGGMHLVQSTDPIAEWPGIAAETADA